MEISSLIGVVAGGITGIIAIVTGLKKFCQHVIVPIREHFEKVHQVIEDVAEIKKKLAYELNANGGNSLKDHVKKYGQQVSRIEGIVLAILSSSDKGVWISDELGGCVWLSGWFDKKLGWNVADMLGNGWKNTIHPDDRGDVAKEFADSVKDGRDFIMDYNYIHKDDNQKTIKVHAVSQPIKRNDGQVIGYIGFVTEITSQ